MNKANTPGKARKSSSSRASQQTPPTKSAKPAPSLKLSPEEKAAAEVLKLVDKAAGLLRQGIEAGARQTASARTKAHQQAHSLLHRAVNSLDSLASGTSSALHTAIDKTLGRPKR